MPLCTNHDLPLFSWRYIDPSEIILTPANSGNLAVFQPPAVLQLQQKFSSHSLPMPRVKIDSFKDAFLSVSAVHTLFSFFRLPILQKKGKGLQLVFLRARRCKRARKLEER